jgi:hypothetical protein
MAGLLGNLTGGNNNQKQGDEQTLGILPHPAVCICILSLLFLAHVIWILFDVFSMAIVDATSTLDSTSTFHWVSADQLWLGTLIS